MKAGKRWPVPSDEDLVPIKSLMSSIGTDVTEQTVYKWTTRGVWVGESPGREKVKLQSRKIGGRVYSSIPSLTRFTRKTNEDFSDAD